MCAGRKEAKGGCPDYTPYTNLFLLDYPAKITLDPISFQARARLLFLLYRIILLTQDTNQDHSRLQHIQGPYLT